MPGAPIVRTPRDIAELRTWMLGQWQHNMPFAKHARSLPSVMAVDYNAPNDEWERRTLAGASLYWVSEEMVDLLLATAISVPDDVMVSDLAPPSGQGLVIFAKPWWGHDSAKNERIKVDAILWGGSHLGPIRDVVKRSKGSVSISTSSYCHMDFSEGLSKSSLDIANATGALAAHGSRGEEIPYTVVSDEEFETMASPNGVGFYDVRSVEGDKVYVAGDGDDFVAQAVKTKDGQVHTHTYVGHSWVPLGRSDWPIHDAISEEPWPMPESMLESFVEDRRVLAALWVLLRQEGIARQEVHHVERHAAKRAVRAGVERSTTNAVQVITLRKLHRNQVEPDPDHVPVKREYAFQWMVDSHFRWQACGVGRKDRRLTFIAPYIKGPEGKPLKVPTRVNAWRR